MNKSAKEIFNEDVEYSKKFEDSLKRDDKKYNEMCLPPNKGKVDYHSLILTMPFHLEEFENIVKGLDELFADYCEELNYKNTINANALTHGSIFRLPLILDRNSGLYSPRSVNKDLGDNISSIQIILHHFLPSTVILHVHALLNPKFSDKLNEIFYKHHETEIKYYEFDEEMVQKRGIMNISSETPADFIKQQDVKKLRTKIKLEIIDFLAGYFNNNFFKLSKKNPLIIPSIETFSLDFPEKKNELEQWLSEYHGFLRCIGVDFSTYKYEDYLLFGSEDSGGNLNYLMFCKEDLSQKQIMFEDFGFMSLLNLLAVGSWLLIQEEVVIKFNKAISEEFRGGKNLDDAIEVRENIYKKIFQFERFKSELGLPSHLRDINIPFLRIYPKGFGEINFTKDLSEGIEKRIEDIENLIKTYYKQSNIILNLENMKYSKNIGKWTYRLSILVVILAGIQIAVAIWIKFI